MDGQAVWASRDLWLPFPRDPVQKLGWRCLNTLTAPCWASAPTSRAKQGGQEERAPVGTGEMEQRAQRGTRPRSGGHFLLWPRPPLTPQVQRH